MLRPVPSVLTALLTLALVACGGDSEDDGKRTPTDEHCVSTEPGVFADTGDPEVDYDCDGYPKSEDCDNRNPDIHPGAPEYNNGVDDDCVGGPGPLYACGTTSYGAFLPLGLGLLRRRGPRRSTRAPANSSRF